MHKRHVTGAGKHREPRMWEANRITDHATAEQSKHLYGMLGADEIGIPDDEQGGW